MRARALREWIGLERKSREASFVLRNVLMRRPFREAEFIAST